MELGRILIEAFAAVSLFGIFAVLMIII